MTPLAPEEIRSAVLQVLAQRLAVLGIEAEEIDGDFELFASGLLDSHGFVDLIVSVEDRLGLQFAVEELDFDDLETVEALVGQLVHRSIQGHQG